MKGHTAATPSREGGQAIIFAAICFMVLALVMSLAIQGGRVYTQYRRLQAATDMAALVGAQTLPCSTNPGSNSTCVSTAQTAACDILSKSLFPQASCSSSVAAIPPIACSPYDFEPYGNAPIASGYPTPTAVSSGTVPTPNPNCRAVKSSPIDYRYIEVTASKSLGTIPVFGTDVSLTAHAVARHGPITSGDYAIDILSPSTKFYIQGNANLSVTGSVFANAGSNFGNNGSGKYALTCDGGWFSTGVDTNADQLKSNGSGSSTFSPSGCTGTTDSTPLQQSGLPPITDPYAASCSPNVGNGVTDSSACTPTTIPNCTECTQLGWWHVYNKWSSSDWNQGGSPSGIVELFPGVYNSLSLGNGDTAFLNPGIYTFTGGIDFQHGSICIYGAPTCGSTGSGGSSSTSCPNISPVDGGNTLGTTGDAWYYKCSPYGYWDPRVLATGQYPKSELYSVPTWYDTSTGSATTTPLNGVTLYLPPSASLGGNGNAKYTYLAAPNPCSGTGSFDATNGYVTWRHNPSDGISGSATAYFNYTDTIASSYEGLSGTYSVGSGSTMRAVYPNYDFSVDAETSSSCSTASTYQVWPGEMPNPQHLHFLFYIRSTGVSKINGGSSMNNTGILYDPGGELDMLGNSGSSGSEPWLTGQIVANKAVITGTADIAIQYRGCASGSVGCGNGRGSVLIQ